MIDDPAEKPASLQPRVSAVKSIITPRRGAEAPPLAEILGCLHEADLETRGFASEGNILSAYVHGLERLYPNARFAMRMVPSSSHRTEMVQAATHRIGSEASVTVTLTEGALSRAGIWAGAKPVAGLTFERTYRPVMEANDEEAPYIDGFDVPLTRGAEVVGVLAVEFDRRQPLDEGLEATALIAGAQASRALENGSLRRETAHLRDYVEKLLEHANIPVLVVGRDRSIRVASRAFRRITGIAQSELVAKDLLQLAPQSERVSVLSAFMDVLRGNSVPPFELQLPRADDGAARLSFKLAPIVDAAGRVAGVIAIGQDRTEVRELEGQVIHAEKLATLGQLAAGIVHEINNPLTSISVYGEYLLDKLSRRGAEADDLGRIERILQSADRIASFTRNLLTYARPSEEEATEVSATRVLDEAVDFCEHLLRHARLEVGRHYAPGLPEVRAVPGQLHQVFVNLITNACNAASDAGGTLTLRARKADDGRIEIQLEDDGVGIAPGDLDQVFEPFFSTRRHGKGTGLGLPIVRNIIEEHGGKIALESKLGAGTIASIRLWPHSA